MMTDKPKPKPEIKSYSMFPLLTIAEIDRRWKFPRTKRAKKKAVKS